MSSLTPEEILTRSAQTYRELQTFRGTCEVHNTSTLSVDGGEPTTSTGTAKATFDFKRSVSFVIEGTTTSGMPFSINNEGEVTRLTTIVKGKTRVIEKESLGLAVAAMTGVAASAPTTIPALLEGDGWGFPFMPNHPATMKESETVAGHKCFVVVQSFEALNSIRTYWIDSQSFLLRQMHEQGFTRRYHDPITKLLSNVERISSDDTDVFTIEE